MKSLIGTLLLTVVMTVNAATFDLGSKARPASASVEKQGECLLVSCRFTPLKALSNDPGRNAIYNDQRARSLCLQAVKLYMKIPADKVMKVSGVSVARPSRDNGSDVEYFFSVPVSGITTHAAPQPVKPVAPPPSAPATTPATVPAVAPAAVPTVAPAAVPTVAPATVPTVAPAAAPTAAPAAAPTAAPAAVPTVAPAAAPTAAPAPAAPAATGASASVKPVSAPRLRTRTSFRLIKYKVDQDGQVSITSSQEYSANDFPDRAAFDDFCDQQFRAIARSSEIAFSEINRRFEENLRRIGGFEK